MPGLYYNYKDFPQLEPDPTLSITVLKDTHTEYMDTCHHFYSIYPEERMRDVSRLNYDPNIRPPTPEEMKIPNGPNKNYFSPIFPLAYKKLIELQIILPGLYFTVSQLAILLDYFPPEESYLRIQLIQSIFSHIVDLENMYLIYDNVLTEDEQLEVNFANFCSTVLVLF